jgi:hypothetical protein
MTNQEQFKCAYWDWKRGLRETEPKPSAYSLDHYTAELLARQCQSEIDKKRLDSIRKSLAAA